MTKPPDGGKPDDIGETVEVTDLARRKAYNLLPAKDKIAFGKVEGKGLVDTPEEFVMASYFSPIEIKDKLMRIKI